MKTIYLENLQIAIKENSSKLTLKELNELYGKDYAPPYFVINGGGRIYPFSEFWKNKLIQLDALVGIELKQIKEKSKNVSQGCSRTWLNNERKSDKILLRQIFGDTNEQNW